MHTNKAPGVHQGLAADLTAFVAALLLLATLLGALHACGDDELILPGGIPATPTPQNTATPEPIEEEDF